jgi:hypothetical protein
MVRPMRAETERYGEYSKAGEFVYDHPFLWGSKRTGPDLHREGGKYPDSWHFLHMKDPRSTSPGSIMPAYAWLYDTALDTTHTEGKIITLRRLGVPYPEGFENGPAQKDLDAQAARVVGNRQRRGRPYTLRPSLREKVTPRKSDYSAWDTCSWIGLASFVNRYAKKASNCSRDAQSLPCSHKSAALFQGLRSMVFLPTVRFRA